MDGGDVSKVQAPKEKNKVEDRKTVPDKKNDGDDVLKKRKKYCSGKEKEKRLITAEGVNGTRSSVHND